MYPDLYPDVGRRRRQSILPYSGDGESIRIYTRMQDEEGDRVSCLTVEMVNVSGSIPGCRTKKEIEYLTLQWRWCMYPHLYPKVGRRRRYSILPYSGDGESIRIYTRRQDGERDRVSYLTIEMVKASGSIPGCRTKKEIDYLTLQQRWCMYPDLYPEVGRRRSQSILPYSRDGESIRIYTRRRQDGEGDRVSYLTVEIVKVSGSIPGGRTEEEIECLWREVARREVSKTAISINSLQSRIKTKQLYLSSYLDKQIISTILYIIAFTMITDCSTQNENLQTMCDADNLMV